MLFSEPRQCLFFVHFSLLDAYGVRGFDSEIKSSKFDFASFVSHTFPANKLEIAGLFGFLQIYILKMSYYDNRQKNQIFRFFGLFLVCHFSIGRFMGKTLRGILSSSQIISARVLSPILYLWTRFSMSSNSMRYHLAIPKKANCFFLHR